MRAIRTRVGKSEVLIGTIDEDLEIMGEDRATRKTQTTGLTEAIEDAYGKAKSAIKAIARDIGAG